MTRSVSLSTAASAILSSSVPAGFVVGALGSAFIGLADRLDPRRVFALSVVFAAGGESSDAVGKRGQWLRP